MGGQAGARIGPVRDETAIWLHAAEVPFSVRQEKVKEAGPKPDSLDREHLGHRSPWPKAKGPGDNQAPAACVACPCLSGGQAGNLRVPVDPHPRLDENRLGWSITDKGQLEMFQAPPRPG